ncbi:MULTISPECIES: universal stress protein UspE [Aliivibrio]|jgi:universal stress protein E|uniref:Universal stress protein UspE n=1 Tax=Aliivibrio finisterrensis TaxID=511998 RepID=A0A4Q5KLT4_9GAMM|nr:MULTISPECIES: universal stress protein UspE [Aliivibrio]MDD9173834.1 universal stress protein UspE [Aliivibrio sp. S3TY1]MDD9178730.1 universal stress protein UspE [Aliivibrio sp. A6]MDD9190911.1 universal stress protein UspE [Aliivibrio sp. S2TY2]RYU46334.1 universal stress protein UspE [Aliivibrio finisterrensis]RYU52435.1 universal stress protein UspE [Aliivibrio finisterrensis]
MNRYRKILVVGIIDQDEQPALDRALDIAKRSTKSSEITLFCTTYDFSYEMTSMLSADERTAMRNGVVSQKVKMFDEIISNYNIPEHVTIKVKMVWHNRPYEAIVNEIFDGSYNLLVKSTRQHAKLETVFFTPTDWHLLRKSPIPVLLVKERTWPENGNILASVHVGSENPTHLALNDKMVDEAKYFAEVLNSTPHLVNAYPSTPPSIHAELPEFDAIQYKDAIRGHHLTEMKALRQKHGIPEEQTHVYEGHTEEVISEVEDELHAALVILGTTGRTGLSAIFIGNTAENTLDLLNSDILALKPEGYISPLDPNHI